MKKCFITISFLLSFVVMAYAQNQVPNISTTGTLTVSVNTLQGALNGYSPKNIVAIWIVDSNGTFVKTLLALAATRKGDLYKWKAATSTYNVVDATTGATQSAYGVRNCTWNGTDVSRVVVPDGNYTVWIELTDDAVQGPFTSYTFAKGPNAVSLSPAALANFSGISIQWAPTATAIDEVQLEKLYTVYPNPTSSMIYVTGFDIQGIDIYTLAGKCILKSSIQTVNLNSLPKGTYLAKVMTKKGTFIKKIEKE